MCSSDLQGGSLYYAPQTAASETKARAKIDFSANEVQKLVFAVAGCAQQDAIQVFPYKAWPYYYPYPIDYAYPEFFPYWAGAPWYFGLAPSIVVVQRFHHFNHGFPRGFGHGFARSFGPSFGIARAGGGGGRR